MSAGVFTVHGITFRSSLWAAVTLSGVTLRQNGDQAEHPAALTSCCSDPPWLTSRPAIHGDGLPVTVFMSFDSIVRQTVSISGAMRCASIKVRQSNDWIV